MYQVWLGGSPAQAGRTGFESHIFKMKMKDLETTMEPIFEMFKTQRISEEEAFGDFCYRVGKEAIQAFMTDYTPKYAVENA
jgi:sulfite reductase (ferredoxin)